MANTKSTIKTKNKISGTSSKAVENEVEKSDLISGRKAMAFCRINYILLMVGMVIVTIGFLLMIGGSSTQQAYNPDIFSPLRIKVAPLVCLFGFLFMIIAILYHKKEDSPKATGDNA